MQRTRLFLDLAGERLVVERGAPRRLGMRHDPDQTGAQARAWRGGQGNEGERPLPGVKLGRIIVVRARMGEQDGQRALGIKMRSRVDAGGLARARAASVRADDEPRRETPSVGEARAKRARARNRSARPSIRYAGGSPTRRRLWRARRPEPRSRRSSRTRRGRFRRRGIRPAAAGSSAPVSSTIRSERSGARDEARRRARRRDSSRKSIERPSRATVRPWPSRSVAPQDDHREARSGEADRGGQTGQTRADDENVAVFKIL